MLSETQRQQLRDEARQIVRDSFHSEVAVQQNARGKEIVKRFSPGFQNEYIGPYKGAESGGHNLVGKIFSSEQRRFVDEPSHPFDSLSDFGMAVIQAGMGNRIPSQKLAKWHESVTKAAGTMEIGLDSAGGYLIPSEYGAPILDRVLEASIIRPRARYVSISSNTLEWPASVDKNHAANFYGGVQVYRTGESQQLTASSPTFEKIKLQLHKITGLCRVTNELIEDSPTSIGSLLMNEFPAAIAFVTDDDFLNGAGANQPLGMLHANNPGLITVAAQTGQGANTVIAENIRDMWSRQVNKSNAIWLANHDVFPQLFGMVLTVGTAGVPIWMPGGNIGVEPYQTLMGRPLIYTEKCQALGTAGDIACVNPGDYLVVGRGDGSPTTAVSLHLRFDFDETAFRFTLRYDGQPLWTSPLTPKYSTTTLSPYVVLNSSRS